MNRMKGIVVALAVFVVVLAGCGQTNGGQQSTVNDIRGGDLTPYIHNIFTGEGAWLAINPDGSGTMWWAESEGYERCAAFNVCVGSAAITAGVLSNGRLHVTSDRIWFTMLAGVNPGNLRKAPSPGAVPIADGYSNLHQAIPVSSHFIPRAEGPKIGDWIEFTITLPSPDDVVNRGPILHDVAHDRSVVFGTYLDGTLERLGGNSDTDWGSMQGQESGQLATPA